MMSGSTRVMVMSAVVVHGYVFLAFVVGDYRLFFSVGVFGEVGAVVLALDGGMVSCVWEGDY